MANYTAKVLNRFLKSNKSRLPRKERIKEFEKLRSKEQNTSEFLEKLFSTNPHNKIKTTLPPTLEDGKDQKNVRNLPVLSVDLAPNWEYIFKTHRRLNVRIRNEGQTPAYNAILELYSTHMKSRYFRYKKNKFRYRNHFALETIFPNQNIEISLFSSDYSAVFAMFLDPHFMMCYDVLLDPRQNVNFDESSHVSQVKLKQLAQNNRKMLYVDSLITLSEKKPIVKTNKIFRNLKRTNLKVRR